jgi:hypothetical protein
VNNSHEIASEDPLELFDTWLTQAQDSEPNDPNAAALATSTRDGVPSVRMVLAKRIGEHRFCFFTNEESQKGKELTQNPRPHCAFTGRLCGDKYERKEKYRSSTQGSRSLLPEPLAASQISAAVRIRVVFFAIVRIWKSESTSSARTIPEKFTGHHSGAAHLCAERIEFCWTAPTGCMTLSIHERDRCRSIASIRNHPDSCYIAIASFEFSRTLDATAQYRLHVGPWMVGGQLFRVTDFAHGGENRVRSV